MAAVLGYRYEGVDSSAIYVVYSLAVAVLGVLMAVFDLIRNGRRLPVAAWMLGMSPALLAASYLADTSNALTESAAWLLFRNYLIWAVPALYVGLYIGGSRRWKEAHRVLDLLMVFLSAGSISALIGYLQQGWDARGIGGATYQTLSYVSALAFGLNLYLLRHRVTPPDGSSTVRSRAYLAVCLVLLPVQLFVAMASGGRGGVVLIAVYVLLELARRGAAGGRLRTAMLAASIVIFAAVLVQFSVPGSLVGAGFDRVFSYVTPAGIDWSGTSGRDLVYSQAVGLIDERLWFGYGPFGFVDGMAPYVYPHNIVLELLLGWGVVGLAGFALVGVPVAHRYIVLRRSDPTLGSLGVLITYQLVMLMFSGTYLAAPTLWFAVGLVVATGASRLEMATSMGSTAGGRVRSGAVESL